jgi:alkylation response protein AidB-like acyl-CoA dehydrogenase
LLDLAVIYEEMGQALLPLTFFNSSVLCGSIIQELGSDSQKKQLLPPIASGQKIYTLALTEEEYGWGPEHIELKAVKKSGKWMLNGIKRFVTDVQAADFILCPARTKSSLQAENGITFFVLDKNTPGIRYRPLKGFTGEKLYEINFTDVVAPEEDILGSVDRGWAGFSVAFNRATAILCAYMVGGCQYLLDLTVLYAQTRVQFNQPIGAFQWVQGYIIEQANQLERARWCTYEALWKLDSDKSLKEQEESVSLAKVVCSEAFLECGHLSHEVHAGIGVDKKYPLYLWSKQSKSLFSYLGDPNFHRRKIAKYMGL